MKELTNVDIISINCVNPQASVAALNHCQKYFQFGKSILVSHIEPSEYYDIELHQLEEKLSWDGYNDHILNLKDHTDNDFVMVIQDDGYIVNPELWDDEFLEYDYIGAPWPIEDNWISMQHKEHQPKLRENLPKNRVGNGGFCIRSRKLLEFSSQFKDTGILGEDTSFVPRCIRKRLIMESSLLPLNWQSSLHMRIHVLSMMVIIGMSSLNLI